MLDTLLCHFLQHVEKAQRKLISDDVQSLLNLPQVDCVGSVVVDLTGLILQAEL